MKICSKHCRFHQSYGERGFLLLNSYFQVPSSATKTTLISAFIELNKSNNPVSINWQIRNIYRFRRFIDFKTCHRIVRSLVLSKLDNCNILLNGLAEKDLKHLQKLQNKCARLICQIPRSDHITPSLDQLHWFPISDGIIYKTVLHVFKSLHGPMDSLHFTLTLVSKIRSRPSSVTTRSSNHIFLEVPPSKKLAGERSFCVSAPKLWNSLSNTIKDASSLDTFKTQLKSYL